MINRRGFLKFLGLTAAVAGVDAGVYRENILITKPHILLEGSGPDKTFIKGIITVNYVETTISSVNISVNDGPCIFYKSVILDSNTLRYLG